jgi:hypothetical protein
VRFDELVCRLGDVIQDAGLASALDDRVWHTTQAADNSAWEANIDGIQRLVLGGAFPGHVEAHIQQLFGLGDSGSQHLHETATLLEGLRQLQGQQKNLAVPVNSGGISATSVHEALDQLVVWKVKFDQEKDEFGDMPTCEKSRTHVSTSPVSASTRPCVNASRSCASTALILTQL